MPLPTQQRAWILANPPTGPLEADTFSLETRPIPELKDGEVLVQVEYLSNDPAQRGWMQKNADPKRLYVAPVLKGDIVRATAVARVLQSKSSKYPEGTRVVGSMGWFDFGVVKETSLTGKAIELPNKPFASISVLGMTTVTAYQGIFDVLDVKPEHTVVVSGAAGAVGSTAIQLAKNVIGAKRVVGIAGGPEKCAWVKKLGADECVDYRDPNFKANLAAALQGEYADRYFENVGGDVLNTMLPLVKRYGKIGVCGMIAGYNGKVDPLPSLFEIISNRLTMQGFIVIDFLPKWAEAVQNVAGWIKQGKIAVDDVETVVSAKIEDVPEKYKLLFTGSNRGKLVTALVSQTSSL